MHVGVFLFKIIVEDDVETDYPFIDIDRLNLVDEVSRKSIKTLGDPKLSLNILVVDCGIKNNQLRCLLNRSVRLTIVPWNHDFSNIGK